MSKDPNQPDQPYYPPQSPYESSPYAPQGQPNYPPPPPGQSEQPVYPPPIEPTQAAYPPTYVTPPSAQSAPSAYPPPQYGTPPSYGVPSYTSAQAPAPARKSRRLLWIILGIVGLLVILIVGGIIGLVVLVNNNPATGVVNGYYSAIKGQNYSQAYSYLAPNLTFQDAAKTPLTQNLFTQVAQQVDQQKGTVSSYALTSSSLNSNNGVNSAKYTVSVTRNGTAYDVHLVLLQFNGQWKIDSFDSF